METPKVACALAFIFCVYVVADAHGGCITKLRKEHSGSITVRTIPSHLQKNQDCGQVCYVGHGVIGCCPVGYICCTPGSISSKCCAVDYPICGKFGCCPNGYPKECGSKYCCKSESYCCGGGETCCASEDQCCGDKCCQQQSPCCTGPNDNKACCDEDKMACCGSTIGCVSQCPCPFDAIGCVPAPANEQSDPTVGLFGLVFGTVNIDCPSPSITNALYRILRADESCNVGLLAKDPSQSRTVNSHVLCGGTKRYEYKSQYISTTSSVEVANYYRNKFDPTLQLQIATIDMTKLHQACVVYDLTTEANRNVYLKGPRSKAYAKASCEVLLSCGAVRVPCTSTSIGTDWRQL